MLTNAAYINKYDHILHDADTLNESVKFHWMFPKHAAKEVTTGTRARNEKGLINSEFPSVN